MSESSSNENGSEATRFQLGNGAWRARSSHGRNPLFASPEELRDACDEYFQWVENNPLMAAETVKFQGIGDLMGVPKMRAMSVIGLCNFLDIGRTTWFDYKSRPNFTNTCERVEASIYQQKFEGAAADMLNANLIGREIGLLDKEETNADGMVDVLRELARRLPD